MVRKPNDNQALELSQVIKLLDVGTPADIPDREGLIERTALLYMAQRERVRRLTSRR